MITSKQCRDFERYIITEDLLSNALDWIESYLSPAEVFPVAALQAWAEENGYVSEGSNEL